MNTILFLVFIALLMNGLFSIIPYLIPRVPLEIVLPYQLWFNILLFMIFVLPHSVGNYKILLKE